MYGCSYKINITIVILSLLFLSGLVEALIPPDLYECSTPCGGRGFCTPLELCEPYKRHIYSNRGSSLAGIIDFLSTSECRSPSERVVCCPIVLHVTENNENAIVENSCGRVPSKYKIVDGTFTEEHEFPWMARIGYRNKKVSQGFYRVQFRCAGTLISSRYVLTAAHCVNDNMVMVNMEPVSVRLGDYDSRDSYGFYEVFKKEQGSTRVRRESTKVEPLEEGGQESDTGEEGGKQEVHQTDLPTSKWECDRKADGESVWLSWTVLVTGWGVTESGKPSSTLKKVEIPLVSQKKCKELYENTLTETQMCAGGGHQDSCNGDSGGPLQVLGKNLRKEPAYIQIGIVSYGLRGCGIQGVPGVYTRVDRYMDWILNNAK